MQLSQHCLGSVYGPTPYLSRAGTTCFFKTIATRPNRILPHCEKCLGIGRVTLWHWQLQKKKKKGPSEAGGLERAAGQGGVRRQGGWRGQGRAGQGGGQVEPREVDVRVQREAV